jgi:hypothetical protein
LSFQPSNLRPAKEKELARGLAPAPGGIVIDMTSLVRGEQLWTDILSGTLDHGLKNRG